VLTRLKVSGFKNLVDVDISFGAFTCIAGENGVGKSNLFDAIRFLSASADHSLIEAARKVRDDAGNGWDVRSLFHRAGNLIENELHFEAEMIIPISGRDDITFSPVKATSTLLRYQLSLQYDATSSTHPLRILSEDLIPIQRGLRNSILRFPKSKDWTDSVVMGRRTVPYISTPVSTESPIVHLHQDRQSGKASGGRSFQHSAASLNRTVLSLANSAETPTTLLAKREMQSWRLLQLEPSALRQQDSFLSPSRLGTNGAHLPATLFRLANRNENSQPLQITAEAQVYARVANRLHELLGEVKRVRVDRDDKRDLLTLEVINRDETAFPAKSLSDGTLRFLALSILAEDPEADGVICFEEPENGIHPHRIPAILELLEDIAVDTSCAVDDDNPLRQVIINTHSPGVVGGVSENDLVFARPMDTVREGHRFDRLQFTYLTGTWRASLVQHSLTTKGEMVHYLRPVHPDAAEEPGGTDRTAKAANSPLSGRKLVRRVADRPDMRSLFEDIVEPA